MECGVCGAPAGIVCHHCGKPLCRDHWKKIVDDAFADVEGLTGRDAYHCEDCKRQFHSQAMELAK